MRRVQAQRKFAAGIHVPVTRQTQQAAVDRRTATPPESRVFQIHTTPSSMLDVVAFQGIHTHKQPVVLLKRLEDTMQPSCSKSSENGESEPPNRYPIRSKSRKSVRRDRSSDTGCSKKRKISKKKSSNSNAFMEIEQSVPITPVSGASADHMIDEEVENVNGYGSMTPLPNTTGCRADKEDSGIVNQVPFGALTDIKQESPFRVSGTSNYVSNLQFENSDEAIANLNVKTKNERTDEYEEFSDNSVIIDDSDGQDAVTSSSITYTPAPNNNCAQNIDDATPSIQNQASTRSNTKKTRNESCPSRHITSLKEIVCCSNTVLNKKCNACKFCSKIKLVSTLVKSLESSSFNLLLSDHINVENLPTDLTDTTNPSISVSSTGDLNNSNNTWNCKLEVPFPETMDDDCDVTETVQNGQLSGTQQQETRNPNASPSTDETSENRRSVFIPSSAVPGPSTSTPTQTPPNSEISSDDEVLSKMRNIERPKMQNAPVFEPTAEEFKDPMVYFESILPKVAEFGLCKVIPPRTFVPPCNLDNEIRFGVTNQYIGRMFKRWGSASKELSNIRANLLAHKIYPRPPLLDGLEVNLPKLFRVVQGLGGLKNVFTKKKWNKVAEEMRYKNLINPKKRLDQIYVKFLLPYDTLTNQERNKLTNHVNRLWKKRSDNMLDRATNPLHRQKRMLAESDSSSDEEYGPDDVKILESLSETEDCIIAGKKMNLKFFKKIANSAVDINVPSGVCNEENVEKIYWKHVETGEDHVCVYAASIDTDEADLGFPNDCEQPYSQHPWNLKRLSENPRNVLSYLGPVVGMTVPTLHLSMVFSTSCWHRDPHGLPWIEYMHEGAEKIWYGIPDDQSNNFRSAVEILGPAFCQNKSIWLPSDITMIPPEMLQKYNVSMCRAVQKPREFIIVCPKAYSCSIATNFAVSESVYFATDSWIKNYVNIFKELTNSCEPAMFSIEKLLLSFTHDQRTPMDILRQIYPTLNEIIKKELKNRRSIKKLGYKGKDIPKKRVDTGAWNVRDQDECELCRVTLYLSKVKGMFHKKTALCLEHGLTILKKKIKPKFPLEVEHIVSSDVLTQILEELQLRLTEGTM
ncbi:protein Jumonji isoform X2 [Colias croceus]|uniref:protein Jumonji isoform X2 n=1 Tax=Colias crocea TaxID=72248 RepID=UPI001E27B438|nr:protein Jumonji isoform X2 [Colias croceus]